MIVASPVVQVTNALGMTVNIPKLVVDFPQIKNYIIKLTPTPDVVTVDFYANKSLRDAIVASPYESLIISLKN